MHARGWPASERPSAPPGKDPAGITPHLYRVPQALQRMALLGGPRRHCGLSLQAGDDGGQGGGLSCQMAGGGEGGRAGRAV